MEHTQKPGDWLCPICQFHNFASRESCFKCRKEREKKFQDWRCADCDFKNFERNTACRKCGLARDTSQKKRLERNTWVCDICQTRSKSIQKWCSNRTCGRLCPISSNEYCICVTCDACVHVSDPRQECCMCERTMSQIRESQKDLTNIWEFLDKRKKAHDKECAEINEINKILKDKKTSCFVTKT